MKIAFFTETYLPNRDGVVSSILTTRAALEKEGHEVYVFCAGSKQAKKENKDARAFYHISTAFSPYPDYKLALFPFFSERKVKQLGIDVIHTHGMATMGLAAARTARTLHLPIVGTLHTLIPEAVHYIAHRKTTMALSKRIAWGYLRWYFNLCDRVLAPSSVIKEVMEEHKIKNVSVLPSGINTQRFSTSVDGSGIRKKFGLEQNKIVLYLGRLVKEKNLDLLVRSALIIMEEIPDCRFIIAGTGPAEEYYKKLVKSAGLEGSFIFTSFLKDEDVPEYYAACDIFVFPSKFETQGLVALEAMGCGKPVAGARFLAIKELVRDGYNGYLFDPDGPDDCAEKVIRTMRERNKLSVNARKTAEEYSAENCARKLLKIYEELVKEK